MRISDWSSDVCSSDREHRARMDQHAFAQAHPAHQGDTRDQHAAFADFAVLADHAARSDHDAGGDARARADAGERSEEHTSELQSLMRISYAVFCLKKKTTENTSYTRT